MVERSGIIVFALWYIAIAYNYYIQNYFRVGIKPRKCRCLMDVPSPTTPCSCSELSTAQGSFDAGPRPGSIKSGGSGRDPLNLIADAAEAIAEVVADEPPPEDDNAGGDAEEPQDELVNELDELVEDAADNE